MSNYRFSLLSVSADAKTAKGEQFGYLTAIIYMAPSDESGVINVCPHASAGCRAACLYTAGRGAMSNVKAGRIRRTLEFVNNRAAFLATLEMELNIFCAIAKAQGLKPAVRLNGTSDLPYENFGIIQKFPDLTFYDYTKDAARFQRFLEGKLPANYTLTFSRSEENGDKATGFIRQGGNVAVVFAGKLPDSYMGAPVISGDESDLRFTDARGVVVGLTSKGRAKKDATGFVVGGAH